MATRRDAGRVWERHAATRVPASSPLPYRVCATARRGSNPDDGGGEARTDDFKPASLSRTRPAGLLAVGKDADVAVQFDAPGEGKPPVAFQGHLVAGTPGGADCVLVFDGKAFRLEQLAGQVKSLRQIRNASKLAHPTPTVVKWWEKDTHETLQGADTGV
jgi:hypothetical protein